MQHFTADHTISRALDADPLSFGAVCVLEAYAVASGMGTIPKRPTLDAEVRTALAVRAREPLDVSPTLTEVLDSSE